MDFQNILAFAEVIIYNATDQYLSELQRDIITGTLMNKTYLEISKNLGYTEGYVKDEGCKLWKIMSDILGEDIKKSNLRSRLKNWDLHLRQFNNNNYTNFSSISPQKYLNPSLSNTSPLIKINLSQMPSLKICYGRVEEVDFLEKQLLELPTRLIGISGISGIGKTTLTIKLVEKIQDKFDYVIWCNLSLYSSLELLVRDLIKFFSQNKIQSINNNNLVSSLMEYFSQNKCLIIWDQGETIFCKCQLAGTCKAEYQNFGELVKNIVNLKHQSCVIFSGHSIAKPMINLFNNEENFIYLLELDGLGISCQEIFKTAKLKDQQLWSNLIEKYSGNPLWLKIVSTAINDLFNGEIAPFLAYDIFPDDLAYLLSKDWQILTKLEQNILIILSDENQAVSLDYLFKKISVSHSNLFNAIQSLLRRKLIKKEVENQNYLFMTLPVIKQLVKELDCRMSN